MAGSRVKGITIEIGGDTTKLQTALKSVNSEIRSTESKLKDVNKLLKMDPGNTELLSQKYKTLQQEIGATKEKLNTLKEAAKQAEQALKDGTVSQDQYDALQREIAETEQNLKSLEKEYKNFGSVQAQEVAAAGEKMKDFGDKVTSVGTGLTTGVTLPLTALGTAGAASFAEVDKTMALTNKTMGNTAEEAEMLNKAMKEAASNSTYGMKDAATATLNFARAGLDAEQAAAALAPAMNLAAGEGGNLDTVSAGLVATINGFHGSFEQAGQYADVFAAACNNSALDVDSLSGAMSVAAPVFASAGYSVNDAALYMGVMANNGIEAEKAANSLKSGLARLISPAKSGAEKMEELGISVTHADGTMKSSIQIQSELHDVFMELSESEQIAAASAIFGKNQMAPWLALINTAPEDVMDLKLSISGAGMSMDSFTEQVKASGGSVDEMKKNLSSLGIDSKTFDEAVQVCSGSAEEFVAILMDSVKEGTTYEDVVNNLGMDLGTLQEAMDNTSGTTQQMADAMMSGFGGSLEKLKSSIDVLVTSVGEALAPTILAVADVVQALVNKFNALTPKQQQIIVQIGLVIAAIGPLLIVIGKLMSSVGTIMTWAPKIVSGMKNLSGLGGKLMGGLKALWAVIAANPMALIIAAVVAAVAAFAYFWTTSESFRQFWIGLWEALKGAVQTVVQMIVTIFTQTVPAAFQSFAGFFRGLWQGILGFFSGLWEEMKLTASGALDSIGSGVSAAWAFVQETTSTVFTSVQTTVSNIWNKIRTGVSTAADGIKTGVAGAWNAVRTGTSAAFNAVKTSAAALWEGIRAKISTAVSGAVSNVSTGWNLVKTATSTVFSAVRSGASTAWGGIKSVVTSAINAIKSGVSGGLNSMKSTAASILNGIKSTFSSAFNSIWNFVSGIVGRLKGVFNFSWSLPHIKLPHFSVSGSFSLNPPSIPHFSVDWYRKAMNNGMILNSPTIFGMSGGKLLGGGEAGPEAVVGVSSLMDMIRSAVGNAQTADTGNITIPVYIGGNLIDEVIVTAQQRRALRSGGRA